MILLEDFELVETMHILFSYLIWKMVACINIYYPECRGHPILAFVGGKENRSFLSFDQHKLPYSPQRGHWSEEK